MPSLIHLPKDLVTGPLTPAGQRPGADAGDPQVHTLPWTGRWDVTETLRKAYTVF